MPKKTTWPKEAVQLAEKLHATLSISEKNWHERKSNNQYRAAELLSGALIQLLKDGESKDIGALAEQSIRWLKKEVKDPGCPHR